MTNKPDNGPKGVNRAMTMRDVAEAANVSVTTVSRALAGKGDIHAETRKRVEDAANEMGYKINKAASNLRSGRTKRIGLLLPDMRDLFFYDVMSGVRKALLHSGLDYSIALSYDQEDGVIKGIEDLVSMGAEGIVICCGVLTEKGDRYVAELKARGIPSVYLINKPDERTGASAVIIQTTEAMRQLTEHLITVNGHRKIAFVKSSDTSLYTDNPQIGFEEVMRLHGCFDPKLVIEVPGMDYEDGEGAVKRLMPVLPELDAIVTCNDPVAYGTIWKLQRMGHKIPDDIAVTGIGGANHFKGMMPSLTSIDYPRLELGEAAVSLLLEMLYNPVMGKGSTMTRTLEAKVVFRESTEGIWPHNGEEGVDEE